MNAEKYPYKTNETYVRFEFQSQGPKGIIKKVVIYYEVGQLDNGTTLLNLAFGDWNDAKKGINDLTISNNADRDKILATIASTVIDIMDHYDNIAIYAEGSTPVRTRLYQMGINANKQEIEKLFDIYGDMDDGWHKIEPGKNYKAFLVTKKNRKFD